MKWLVPFSFLMLFEIVGNFLSALFYSVHNWLFFSFVLGVFALANYFWLISLKNGSGLARGTVYFGVAIVVSTTAIGLIFYNETLSMLKVVGIIIGLVSLILLSKGKK